MNRTSLRNSKKAISSEKKTARTGSATSKKSPAQSRALSTSKKNSTRTKKIVKTGVAILSAALAGGAASAAEMSRKHTNYGKKKRGEGEQLVHSDPKAGGYNDEIKNKLDEKNAKLEKNGQAQQSDSKSSPDQKQQLKEGGREENSSKDLKDKTGQSQRSYEQDREALKRSAGQNKSTVPSAKSATTSIVTAVGASAAIGAGVVIANNQNKASTGTPNPYNPPDPETPKPVLLTVNPSSGFAQGGERVTLSGEQFIQGASVNFAGKTANVISISADGKTMEVTTPSGTAGQVVEVTVTTKGGSTTLNAAFKYTYPEPILSGIDRHQGSASGNEQVVLSGQNFVVGASVAFGIGNAAQVQQVSDDGKTIIALTPRGTIGQRVDVIITTQGGSATLPAVFEYLDPNPPLPTQPAPTLTSLSQTKGPLAGGQTMSVAGTNFTPDAVIYFGDQVLRPAFIDDTQLKFNCPSAEQAGEVKLKVKTQWGTSGALGFTYEADTPIPPVPTLTRLSATKGPLAGGQPMSVTGTGFAQDAMVYFGPVPVTPAFVDDTRLDFNCPLATQAGDVFVKVITRGVSTGTMTFTYESDLPDPDDNPTDPEDFWNDSTKKKLAIGGATLAIVTGVGVKTLYARHQNNQRTAAIRSLHKEAAYGGIMKVMQTLGYGQAETANKPVLNFVCASLNSHTVGLIRQLIEKISAQDLMTNSVDISTWLEKNFLPIKKKNIRAITDPVELIEICVVAICISKRLKHYVKHFSKKGAARAGLSAAESSILKEGGAIDLLSRVSVSYSQVAERCLKQLSNTALTYVPLNSALLTMHLDSASQAATLFQSATSEKEVVQARQKAEAATNTSGVVLPFLTYQLINNLEAPAKLKRLVGVLNLAALAVEVAALDSADFEREAAKKIVPLRKWVPHFEAHLAQSPTVLLHSLVLEDSPSEWVEGLEEDYQTLQFFKSKKATSAGLTAEDTFCAQALWIRNWVRSHRMRTSIDHAVFVHIKPLCNKLWQDIKEFFTEEDSERLCVIADKIIKFLSLESAVPNAAVVALAVREGSVCPSCKHAIDWLNYQAKDLRCSHCHMPWAVFNPAQGQLIFQELENIRQAGLEPLGAGVRYSAYSMTICWLIGLLFLPSLPFVIASMLGMMTAVSGLSYGTFNVVSKAIHLKNYYQYRQQNTDRVSVLKVCFNFLHEAARFLKGIASFLPFAHMVESLTQGLNFVMSGVRGTQLVANLGLDLYGRTHLGFETYQKKLQADEKQIESLFTSPLDHSSYTDTSAFYDASSQSYYEQDFHYTFSTLARELNQHLPDILVLFPKEFNGLSIANGTLDEEYVQHLLETFIDSATRAEVAAGNPGYFMLASDIKDTIVGIAKAELGYKFGEEKEKSKLLEDLEESPLVRSLCASQEHLNAAYGKLAHKSPESAKKVEAINRIINLIKLITFIDFKAFGGDVFPFQIKLIEHIRALSANAVAMLPMQHAFEQSKQNLEHEMQELSSTPIRNKPISFNDGNHYVELSDLSRLVTLKTLKNAVLAYKYSVLDKLISSGEVSQEDLALYGKARAFYYFYSVLQLYRARAEILHRKYRIPTTPADKMPDQYGGLNLWGTAALRHGDSVMSQATEPVEYQRLVSKIKNLKTVLQSVMVHR